MNIVDSMTKVANYLLAYKLRLSIDSIVFGTNLTEIEVRESINFFLEKGLVDFDSINDTVQVKKKRI